LNEPENPSYSTLPNIARDGVLTFLAILVGAYIGRARGAEIGNCGRPKGGQPSLRAVASELARRGYLNERGKPFAAKSIASMLTR